jgi:hypothetical protein
MMRKIRMKQFLEGLLLSTIAVLAPIKAVMIVVGVLIVVDFVTGYLAARKRGEKFTSAKFRNSITKCLIYQTAVITGFLVERYMMDGVIPVSKIVSGLIASVEFTSVLENLDTIHGSSIFKTIIEKLGSKNLPK